MNSERPFRRFWIQAGTSSASPSGNLNLNTGVGHCAGVASGLDALILALEALDMDPGSEVIVPSNTYIATIISIIRAGHRPVLVEPDIRTYNIDPARIEEAITLKTRAILVVHLYGKVCDMDPILEICSRRGLRLVEDCAQSHGATYKDRKAGGFGDLAAFSFYPTKNLGALGDGGAVLTADPSLHEKVMMLRNYGSPEKYLNRYIGYNSRLDEIQAAFLSIKLKSLDEINRRKRALAALYHEGLKRDYILPHVDTDYRDVYHIFNIRHTERDRIREYLLNNGVKTEIHYPVPPHRQEAMRSMSGMSFPVSDEIHDTTLSLPVSSCHSKDEITRVIEILNKY
jgi:dTDP-4-amino-4,6-dideoxygalactose transaminase